MCNLCVIYLVVSNIIATFASDKETNIINRLHQIA